MKLPVEVLILQLQHAMALRHNLAGRMKISASKVGAPCLFHVEVEGIVFDNEDWIAFEDTSITKLFAAMGSRFPITAARFPDVFRELNRRLGDFHCVTSGWNTGTRTFNFFVAPFHLEDFLERCHAWGLSPEKGERWSIRGFSLQIPFHFFGIERPEQWR
jgi:hypothetical protein